MSILIAQQKKLTESLRRRRQKIKFPRNRNTDVDPTVTPDVDDAPIRPSSPILNNFPDSQVPFSKDSPQHSSDPIDMPTAYRYNLPLWSTRDTVDHSDDEGSDSTSDSEGNTDKCSDDESDNDQELWSDDVEPWLRGMSAISRLEEEFEQEAAARGTTYHINLICL
jgi:hypothetical protein